MKIGDTVFNSPVGSGVITDFTAAGYPKVNDIAVGRLVCLNESKEFVVFDPVATYKKGKYRMGTRTSLGTRTGDVIVSSYEEAQAFIKAVGCEPEEVLGPHYFTLSNNLCTNSY